MNQTRICQFVRLPFRDSDFRSAQSAYQDNPKHQFNLHRMARQNRYSCQKSNAFKHSRLNTVIRSMIEVPFFVRFEAQTQLKMSHP